MHLILAFMLSLSVTFGALAGSSDRETKEKELSALKNRIEKLRKTIEVKENSKSQYNRQLRHIEKQIGDISQQIRASNQAVKLKQQELKQLDDNKKTLENTIYQQNRQLAKQIHTAYTLGQQEQMKLLFSQQNPGNLQRNLTYYQYFSNFRVKQIEQAQQHFSQLVENEKLIKQAKLELERELEKQKQQKQSLSTDRAERKKIVRSLDQELRKQGKHLTQLEDDARNLKQLIDSLSDILTEIPSPTHSTQKFSSLRGKLAWPVKGKVQKLFGQPKPPSNLRWQGVVINAPSGNNVRAVSHGRVAFADWLRGMGNLIIIDHGEGYLSLYGHNESLFKSAGEWVEAGDIIGSIGDSGGQKDPGLYFEIRRQGKPQNPSRWCKSNNWFATS